MNHTTNEEKRTWHETVPTAAAIAPFVGANIDWAAEDCEALDTIAATSGANRFYSLPSNSYVVAYRDELPLYEVMAGRVEARTGNDGLPHMHGFTADNSHPYELGFQRRPDLGVKPPRARSRTRTPPRTKTVVNQGFVPSTSPTDGHR